VDFIDGVSRERSVKDFFKTLKAEYRTLAMVPIGPRHVAKASGSIANPKQIRN
jgi:hypothetical protein